MTDHEERILAALRALGPSGGDAGSVACRAYRLPTTYLRRQTLNTLRRLVRAGLVGSLELRIGGRVVGTVFAALGGAAEGEGGSA